MTRVRSTWFVAAVAAAASAVALLMSAAPAGATLVCPKGVTNPKYCTNVPPIATTGVAKPVGTTTATLNGVSGPNVTNGDVTTFFFNWGLTKAYGNSTPSGTVGTCPAGSSNPAYCTVPKTQAVSAPITGLQPCTTYHFQIISTNPDATTTGGDATFRTHFARPITSVTAPRTVKRFHRFTVHIKLAFRARITIQIRRAGKVVKKYRLGFQGPGSISKKVSAPGRKGNYYLRVIGDEGCGKQTVNKKLRVK